MIPRKCKRLAEVDFPIAEVSKHSAREKSIRHGHPSTLHLWWARRPLAACRAMLMALLLPDPVDEHCPPMFREEARRILVGSPVNLLPDEGDPPVAETGLRRSLLKFIGDFANWDHSSQPLYLKTARALVKAAHGEDAPLVVDPFAGGGSIPLEALRVGCDAFASDLNPVACLILKAMLEDIPRNRAGLSDELRRVGTEIEKLAVRELSEYYSPIEPDGSHPIAYIWARTAICEAPNCGGEIPLFSSCLLAKTKRALTALHYEVEANDNGEPRLKFSIISPDSLLEIQNGTVSRSKATCPFCGAVLTSDRLVAQLSKQNGGADPIFNDVGTRVGGARLLAVVTRTSGKPGRSYRTSQHSDYRAVKATQDRLAVGSMKDLPEEILERVPVPFGVLNVRVYGIDNWGKLFSSRQKLALQVFTNQIKKYAKSPHIQRLLLLPFGKLIDFNTSAARWASGRETSAATFGRPAIPMVWDYCETVPLSGSTGSWRGALEYVCKVIENLQSFLKNPAAVNSLDARKLGAPDESMDAYFTDPPYYDNVPYSYISDTFYVWQKRVLRESNPNTYSSTLTPKEQELVAYMGSDGNKAAAKDRFERGLTEAFTEGVRATKPNGVGCVVFAHQTTDGWESLLASLIGGGWTITSSWPIATERSVRPRAQESAALATSVHLVGRPRTEEAIGDWSEVHKELPIRVKTWMARLQAEGVRGADLVFACIGPALEIYSRYSKVLDAQDREIGLAGDPMAEEPHVRGYLAYVWETVARVALEEILGTREGTTTVGGGLEEDARLTALFLWTLQDTSTRNGNDSSSKELDEEEVRKATKGGFKLIYDVARRFAQPLGIHLEEWEGVIIENKKGIVRLLPIRERSKQLFGREGAEAMGRRFETADRRGQNITFDFFSESTEAAVPEVRGRRRAGVSTGELGEESFRTRQTATTLDRVHAAMLLQAGGQANALRALLKAEIDRGPDFMRLANALSALYPKGSEEKRLLDAMLLAVPR